MSINLLLAKPDSRMLRNDRRHTVAKILRRWNGPLFEHLKLSHKVIFFYAVRTLEETAKWRQ